MNKLWAIQITCLRSSKLSLCLILTCPHFYNIESERLENNYIEILLATQMRKQIMQISCKSPDMTHYDMIDVTTFS
jgi:hypothetical protein